MASIFKVPLEPQAQSFVISLKGVNYRIINRWNSYINNWFIDIIDNTTDTPLILSMPLVTGIDLLEQYTFLGIGGKLIVYTDGDAFATPTYTNLGSDSNLYYVVED